MATIAELAFPVDAVFTWVDGSDPVHIEARKLYLENNEINRRRKSTNPCRWRNNGELEQSIQSVKTYAPWIRNIFVVTGLKQRPTVTHNDTGIQPVIIVDHEDIFASNVPALPVFNSHAIEANLWRIPNLSEHFIYFNDDTFLGAPLRREQCFSKHGSFVLFQSGMIDRGPIDRRMASWWNSRRTTGNLIAKLFGERQRPATHHQARPLMKSVCEDTWNNPVLNIHLTRVSRSRFRSCTDIDPINMFSLYGLETGRCTIGNIHGLVTSVKDNTNISDLVAQFRRKYAMYCINDDMTHPSVALRDAYSQFLKHNLPHHYLRKDLRLRVDRGPVRIDTGPVVPVRIDNRPVVPVRVDKGPLVLGRVDNRPLVPVRADKGPARIDRDLADRGPGRVDNRPVVPGRADNRPLVPVREAARIDRDPEGRVDNRPVVPGRADNRPLVPVREAVRIDRDPITGLRTNRYPTRTDRAPRPTLTELGVPGPAVTRVPAVPMVAARRSVVVRADGNCVDSVFGK